MYKIFFKRFFDFVLASIGLVLLSPILLIVTIILFLNNNGKPFFIQKRPGRNERVFSLLKFRTMTDTKDANGLLLADNERLTRIGLFVRKTSIDEIPQLINVLVGDMSIVGPRPLLIEYLKKYTNEQKQRHNVRPGITGWAQINGRNNITWNDKFKMDIWYTNNYSFRLDMRIIFITIKKVILRKDINLSGNATTVAFNGNN
jgi:lipopolysaccharide/colanic/teichoic acid biosynthesis glycosyltransferase